MYAGASDSLKTKPRLKQLNSIFKTSFTAQATSKVARSGIIHSPEELEDVALGNPFQKGIEN